MASPVCMKRMQKEREKFAKQDGTEYFVHFKDEDLLNFTAYIVGPEDSLYKHKFLKFKFEIPANYPLVPPKVKFIQYSGDRIHPNLYVDGKVCLSILGTWHGEPWATAMNVESVLITIRSLLDNHPYKHEPGQKDHPGFNAYVEYAGWQCLVLDHLKNEQEASAKAFLEHYVGKHGKEMIDDLARQAQKNVNVKTFRSPYAILGRSMQAEYPSLDRALKGAVSACSPSDAQLTGVNSQETTTTLNTGQKSFSWNPFKRKAVNSGTDTTTPDGEEQASPQKRHKEIIDLT